MATAAMSSSCAAASRMLIGAFGLQLLQCGCGRHIWIRLSWIRNLCYTRGSWSVKLLLSNRPEETAQSVMDCNPQLSQSGPFAARASPLCRRRRRCNRTPPPCVRRCCDTCVCPSHSTRRRAGAARLLTPIATTVLLAHSPASCDSEGPVMEWAAARVFHDAGHSGGRVRPRQRPSKRKNWTPPQSTDCECRASTISRYHVERKNSG